jgi:protein-S-isoprenylcysteine O-methyltransferase Ste14
MKTNSSFKYTEYFNRTIFPAIIVVLSLVPLFFIKKYYAPMSLSSTICVGVFSVFATILSIALLGLKTEERKVLYNYVLKKIGYRL